MTRVKVCGMMEPDDLEAAKGADYRGFVVESTSRRSLPLAKAKQLMASCSGKRVAVTSSTDADIIVSLVDVLEPEIVQIHSLLPPPELRSVGKECSCDLWGLVPIGTGGEMQRALSMGDSVDAFVLDTKDAVPGGTGRTHDWAISSSIREALSPSPVILAGGLTPDNVADAIRSTRPYAVDVSTGVERERRKDPDLIERFIRNAKEVSL